MKSFKILFSIFAILVFAVGCMHKEKELLTPTQPELRQTVQYQATQGNKGGDEVWGSNICPTPTNLVETPINGGILLSWTGSASAYSVKYYLNGAILIINTTVNQPQIQLPLPEKVTYYVEVRGICGGVLSVPLTGSGGTTGTGGTGILICDDLNNIVNIAGSYYSNASHSYTHNTQYTTTMLPNIMKAENLYTSTGLASPSSVSVANNSPTNTTTLRFITPNPITKNTECTVNNLSAIDITVNLPSSTTSGNVSAIAYCEDVAGAQWNIVGCSAGSSVRLSQLKRNTIYKIKFFAYYTNLTSFAQYTFPCPSIW